MPEVVLKFQLPEDQSDLNAALKGAKYASALWQLDQKLHSVVKYGCTEKDAVELAQHIRDEIRDMVGDLEED